MNFINEFNPKLRKRYFLNLEVGDRCRLIGKETHPHYKNIRINGEVVEVYKPKKLKEPIRYLLILENGDIVTSTPASIIRILK